MSTLDDWVSTREGLSLDEQDAGMGPTEWPACRYPERRFDDNTVLHARLMNAEENHEVHGERFAALCIPKEADRG